jgi:hypothetical protein
MSISNLQVSVDTYTDLKCNKIDANSIIVDNPVYEFVEVNSSGSQSLPNNTVANLENWAIVQQFGNDIIKSLDNDYDFEVLKDGVYSVQSTVSYQPNATGDRALIIYMNNENRGHSTQTAVNPADTGATRIQCYARAFLSSGDRIRLAGYQTSGAPLLVKDTGLSKLTISRER